MVKYKTIKISECTYNVIKRVQAELVEEGLDSIPREVLEKYNSEKDFTIGAIINMGVGIFNQHLKDAQERVSKSPRTPL